MLSVVAPQKVLSYLDRPIINVLKLLRRWEVFLASYNICGLGKSLPECAPHCFLIWGGLAAPEKYLAGAIQRTFTEWKAQYC